MCTSANFGAEIATCTNTATNIGTENCTEKKMKVDQFGVTHARKISPSSGELFCANRVLRHQICTQIIRVHLCTLYFLFCYHLCAYIANLCLKSCLKDGIKIILVVATSLENM